jgi:hypothetical protein
MHLALQVIHFERRRTEQRFANRLIFFSQTKGGVMKNVFSSEEISPTVETAFLTQQPDIRPTAPPCNPIMPHPAPVELRMPDFEDLAHRSAPGSAVSADLTYRWR